MKIGIIASSNGGAFKTFHDLLTAAFPRKYSFMAITDRPCGFEYLCDERNIPRQRVNGRNNSAISKKAADFFSAQGGVDIIILYFLRLVTPIIFRQYPTFNIHPSLLPAFSGFNPVNRAFETGVKFFGASLHQVDGSVDNGPLIAQMAMPVAPTDTLVKLEKYSYLHKVYLALLLVDLIEQNVLRIRKDGTAALGKKYLFNDRSCPALSNEVLLKHFYVLQRREGAEVII